MNYKTVSTHKPLNLNCSLSEKSLMYGSFNVQPTKENNYLLVVGVKLKKDIRKNITTLSSDIGSVVCKANGTLQVCYYDNKELIKDIVIRYLGKNSLLECFVKIDFIECPKPEVNGCSPLDDKQEGGNGIPPTNKLVGILPKRL